MPRISIFGGGVSRLTTGGVLFGGSTGLIAQDSSNLFWDDSIDFLGIGTASPASLLDINPSGPLSLQGLC